MRIYIYVIIVFSLLFCLSCSQKQPAEKIYSGAYLGLNPPDSSATIFAPDFINTGMATRDITFTPDGKEIYFCANIGNHTYSTILFTKEISGQWTKPKVVSFAENLEYMYVEPHCSVDGSKLFFASNQPKDNGAFNPEDTDIWFVNRQGDGWGKAQNLGTPVNTDGPEFFPSLAKNGNLYFTRDDSKTGVSYIYRSIFDGQNYLEPEFMPENINTGRSRFNAFVDPGERYLIIPIFGLPDSYGGTDYYISFRTAENSWTDPAHFGKNINSESRFEYSSSVSPDGKYLFFMSSGRETKKQFTKKPVTIDDLISLHNQAGNGNPNIYWTDATIITQMEKQAFRNK